MENFFFFIVPGSCFLEDELRVLRQGVAKWEYFDFVLESLLEI